MSASVRLGVNIDHVATLRQARRTYEPSPVTAAALAEMAGADGITCHLREDRRHIQDEDLRLLRQTVTTSLNLEMALAEEIIAIALAIKPDQVTLVPERREEVTTEGGLAVTEQIGRIKSAVERMRGAGVLVSIFIDPVEHEIEAASECGADAVELHTGVYANARGRAAQGELARLVEGSRSANKAGLKVFAGHGLTYHNVVPVAAIPEIEELNIGHSIVSRAVFAGLGEAVREMKRLIDSCQ